MTRTRDVDSIAADILPYDGPHAPDALALTASVLAELVHRLNNATGPWSAAGTLPYPDGIDILVGRLSGMVVGLDQLMGQLAFRLGHFAQDERLEVDSRGPKLTPADTAALAVHHLQEAQTWLTQAHQALTQAQNYTARLAWNDGSDD